MDELFDVLSQGKAKNTKRVKINTICFNFIKLVSILSEARFKTGYKFVVYTYLL